MYVDVPKEFGVPDEIGDMTRSLEMVRDVKIDILDDYIRTSEKFRVIRVFLEYRGVTGIHREKYWALLGHTGIEERGRKEGGAHPPSGPNWTRGAAPFSFLLSPSFLLSYSGKERGILLGLGSPSRTPHTWRAPSRAGLSLPPLYTGAGGHPIDTTIDLLIS